MTYDPRNTRPSAHDPRLTDPSQWHPRAELYASPSRAKANWSIALAAIPTVVTLPIAIMLATAVLRQPDLGPDHGRRRAWTALAMVATWAVAIVVVLAVQSMQSPDTATEPRRGVVATSQLHAGDCLPDDISTRTTRSVDIVPCSESHWMEVYAVSELTDGPFPGRADVIERTARVCAEKFDVFIGAPEDPAIDLVQTYPATAEAWATDRQFSCLVRHSTARVGSLEKAGLTAS